MMTPFSGPRFHENAERCKGSEWPCAYCGKPIKEKDKAMWVFICCGQFEPAGGEEAHQHHPWNMGGYPLGPDCARKYRREKAVVA